MTFTNKLTYAEQRALSHADTLAYWDWLFDYNDPLSKRWAIKEFIPLRDLDAERAKKNGEGY